MKGTVKEAHLGFAARFLRGFAWCLVHTVQRPKLSGVKPELDEPTIFVCSHVGLMDPVILMVEYIRYMIRPMVAKDYVEKNGFTRRFYPLAQCIPIDRRNVSTKWLEDALAARMERGQFQGILVGLGSAVDEKQLIVVITADAAQSFG